MHEVTFLTEEQIFGNNQLDILKKYGVKCAITDFSILLGGVVASSYYTNEGNTLKDRTGCWWSQTPFWDFGTDVESVVLNGRCLSNSVHECDVGARPVLPYSSILEGSSEKLRGKNGILEVEYGEYPQDIVSEDFARTLETAFATMPYLNDEMKLTGKSYTTDSVRYQDKDIPFQARTHTEYEYNGKKYIRFVGDNNCEEKKLSDGRIAKKDEVYWLEVQPIKWLIDEQTGIAITKKIIFSGVQFNNKENYRGKFRKTTIYNFLNTFFVKDIIPSKIEEKNKSKVEKIIQEISSNIEYLENKEEIIEEINKLINETNNKLDVLRKKRNDESINLSLDTVESVTQNLEISLGMILERFKSSSNYLDIINYIDKCLLIPEKLIEDNDDDKLIEDLTILIKDCLPFLKEEDQIKIKDNIFRIFNEEKDKIKNYLNVKYKQENVKLKYSNKDEFTIEIRKKLQPILEYLNDKANKRNIELEISKSLNNIINHTFSFSKDKELSIYLNEVNNLTTKINILLQSVKNKTKKEIYMDKLSNILSVNIDYNKNTENILEQVRNMIISLHKLSFDINEYLKDIKNIDNSYISPIKRSN